MKTFAIDNTRFPDFIDLAWTLNAHVPLWVPPIRSSLIHELSRESPAARHQRRRLFLCTEGSQILGRVAAIVDARWTDTLGKPIGQVGYFEAVNDTGVARSLLDTACAWLGDQDVSRVVGPINGGAHHPHRFMTRGFEREPFLFEPRNPPYYPDLFREYGFEVIRQWHSFDTTAQELRQIAARPAIARSKARLQESYHLSFPDPRDTEASLARIYGLLEAVWQGHVGFINIDVKEFTEVAVPLLSLMTVKDLSIIVNRAAEDVGFGFSYPDYAAEVRRLGGDGAGWAAWMNTAKPTRYVLHTVAARRSDRTGASILPILNAIDVLSERHYELAVVALVVEDFHFFQRSLQPTRSYALFGLPIQT